ncbi:DsrE family protein [Porifericola rhodea]|uniref:DsrE family protein n=1 Tax=Porifericola rhodea TaxID=930972 RepID=UPI00266565FD|nr:DsrE family protein [Porifericola rhodea]WKN30214.1 DsrE family protein [Porifericola rhodea]
MKTPTQHNETNKFVDVNKHKVVMQVTQSDALNQLSVISQLKNIKAALPNAEIKVVVHSQGLEMLVESRSKVRQHIEELSRQQLSFIVCENTMSRQKVSQEDLIKGVATVPSGLVEIILKQKEGWSYIKGGV